MLQYTHLGQELTVDTSKSNYLKRSFAGRELVLPGQSEGKEEEFASAHNMDVHLHGVAGVQENNGFRLAVDHDIALVNKYLDRLKDEHKIPPNWWNGENRKKMVQMEDGHWKVI
ncbi:hypothetical protein REPUB_Repub02eG0179800 [Reevesia pubescens]